MSGVKEERSISLLLRLDLEFLESTPKTLINSLHATARNFDTPSYWTLTVLLGAFLDKINVKSEENAMKNRVKELRDAKHLTQTGLALKVGSTQQTISKIEREIGVPKLDLALIMADFFNVTLEYLFCLSDKKHKLEHQIEIDKTIEEFYDFFVDYQDLNSENKETLNLIMRRLLEVQANEEAE